MLHRPAQGPTPSNQLLHDTVTMQDPLGVGRCGEAAHLTLRLWRPRRLMGSFGGLVRVLGRVVGATGHDVPLGTSGAAPRVGHETTRVLSLTLQACSEASPRRPPVPTGVDEKVTPVTVVVHGAQAFISHRQHWPVDCRRGCMGHCAPWRPWHARVEETPCGC